MNNIAGLKVPNERIVAESTLSFAVALKHPLTPGHVVCLPKRRCPKQTDMTANEFCDLYELATRLGKAIADHHQMTGVTYIINVCYSIQIDEGGCLIV